MSLLPSRLRYLTQNYLPRRVLEPIMRRRLLGAPAPGPDIADRFTRIFEQRLWGDHESVSGRGSTLENTAVVRRALPELLQELDVRRLLDVPCGDYHWMHQVELGDVEYVGADVVDALVQRNQDLYGSPRRRFVRLDLCSDPLPDTDIALIRDCWIHLSFKDVARAVANLKRSKVRWLLTTTYPKKRHNFDIPSGSFRELNLERYPFHFPNPERLIREDVNANRPDHERHLGLWSVPALPHLDL